MGLGEQVLRSSIHYIGGPDSRRVWAEAGSLDLELPIIAGRHGVDGPGNGRRLSPEAWPARPGQHEDG